MIFPFKPSTYKGFPIAMFDSQVLKGSYGPISHDVNHESQDLYRIITTTKKYAIKLITIMTMRVTRTMRKVRIIRTVRNV